MQNGPNQPNQPNQSDQPTWLNSAPTFPSSQTPNTPLSQSYGGKGRMLAIVAVLYALGWWFAFAGAIGNIAIYGLAAGLITILCLALFVIDWRGYTSLAGLIKWRQMSTGGRVGMGCLFYCFLPLMPVIYLIRAIGQYYRTSGQTFTGQVGQFFRSLPQRTARARTILVTGSIVAALSFCTLTGVAVGSGHPAFDTSSLANATSTPNATSVNGVTHASTASPRPAPTATPQTTATPTPPKPKPTATSKPKPSCAYPAVNGNPWCYTFTNTGRYITNPPGGFCGYFNCISSFWNGSGYVMECQDKTYSKSGGRTGSCSRHGGDLRPLYAP